MINQTRLLIDAGNSRIKWTIADEKSHFDTIKSHSDLGSALDAWKGLSKPTQVWLASVRDKQFSKELSSAIKTLWALSINEISSSRQLLCVTNAYPEPEQLGCDRWAAMLAAYNQEKSSVLVVSLGTAMTIDAIDANGFHLGGLICPGMYLQQQALNAGTNVSCIPELKGPGGVKLFAASTAEGIIAGSTHAISALIDKAYQDRIEQEANTICYLAGGDAEKIKDTLQCPYIIEPYLVLKGIALIAAAE